MKNDITTIREALRTDKRTIYEIAKQAGLSNTILATFKNSSTKSLSTETLVALVPVLLPGHAFGLHKTES